MLRTLVFKWHKRFSEGREEVDDKLSGNPSTSKTGENIEKVNNIFWNDKHLSIRMIANMVNIDKETVQKMVHNKLNEKSLFKNSTEKSHLELKRHLKSHLFGYLTTNKWAIKFIKIRHGIDETWIFQYDLETKWQSMHWNAISNWKKGEDKRWNQRLNIW